MERLKTEKYASDERVEFTNDTGATLKAGTPVYEAGRWGIVQRDLEDGESGELLVRGRFRAAKISQAWDAGDLVGYDAAGDPVGGEAGSGAYTKTTGNWELGPAAAVGMVERDAASGAEFGIILLNEISATPTTTTTAGG